MYSITLAETRCHLHELSCVVCLLVTIPHNLVHGLWTLLQLRNKVCSWLHRVHY